MKRIRFSRIEQIARWCFYQMPVWMLWATPAFSQSYNWQTICGGPGWVHNPDGTNSFAHFDSPCGVLVDNADNFYVADTYHHTIRKTPPGTFMLRKSTTTSFES